MSHAHRHHDAHHSGQEPRFGQDRNKSKPAYGAFLMAILACAIAVASLPPFYPRVLAQIEKRTGAKIPPLFAVPATAEDATLAARLSALETRVQTLAAPAPAASPSDSGAATAQLDQRLTKLETQVQELTTRSAELQTLMRTALTDSRGLEKRLAVVLALQAAIVNGRPFMTELDWLRQYSNDDVTAAVTELLLPYSKRGVAPMIDLRDALDQSDFVEAIRNTALTDVSVATRVQRTTMNWLGDMGLTQKPTPLPVDAVLDEMRLAMARGQLSEALQASSKLQGPAAAMMAPWTTRAKARLMAEEIAQRLLTTTLQKN